MMNPLLRKVSFAAAVLFFFCLSSGCEQKADTRFIKLSANDSGIDFENHLEESPEVNIMAYEYTYNGGGVAAADFNNDGRCDLYFTGNAVSNRLYINEGELKFKDITEKAGVGGRRLWKTGVTSADVNGDGWLDLYVCYSGPELKQSLSNELYISNGISNQGELTFTERAKEYGLDAPDTYSTQAAFFDYDLDGDLDMFLINHGNHFYSPFINTNRLRNMRHSQFGNRLYRNDLVSIQGGKTVTQKTPTYTEVSQQANIHGGGLNFGLGVSISDVNDDGWPDIFVTNDYEEQDFLYLNKGDGTFEEVTKKSFGHLSRNGMGSDIADFNNDALPDLVEVDMWPEDNLRQKLLKGSDDYNRYTLMVDSGFHHQQMRNTLQVNAGTASDGHPVFCEIGQLAGISSTDWSWAPLFADLDNDGFKDLFITNGYLRDFTSMDFLKYTVEDARKKSREQGQELELYKLVSQMPSTKTSDYVFKNNGDLTFTDQSIAWGMSLPNLSFGATYADLDNDGDLELITNNTNETASLWINHGGDAENNNYVRIKLKGSALNTYGVGAKITLHYEGIKQRVEHYNTRGYQGSVENIIHFGVGKQSVINTITVLWPDGKMSSMNNVNANQVIEIDYITAKRVEGISRPQNRTEIFHDVTASSGVNFVHHENPFVDFDREPLIPYQLSRLGPALASGDVSGDGIDDFFIGGALGQSGKLFIGNKNGSFEEAKTQPWRDDLTMEDVGAVFFDVDNDQDADLFVVSGGNEYPLGSPMLDDRLYLNDGHGSFVKAPQGSIVADHASGSCVAAADFDRDGDLDLYVGGRLSPGAFPLTAPGALLRNDTDRATKVIKFTVVTKEVNTALREPGMVTDALWTDFDNDQWPDLILVGEWMPIKIFKNNKGKFELIGDSTLAMSDGLWRRITAFDYDQDGDQDFVVGNAGDNLPWKVSKISPLKIYHNDFNDDARIDPVICYTVGQKEYPVASRDEMLLQVNSLRKKFISYSSYGSAVIQDVFDAQKLNEATKLQVNTTSSVVLENRGNGKFSLKPLPILSQISSVNGIVTADFNNDGFLDILLSGNFYPYRTQYGQSDASVGLLLTGNGKGAWTPVSWKASGFYAGGDVRDMKMLIGTNRKAIVVARNNDKLSLIELKP